jgi:V8-like Glu-specific endopeptidase
MTMPTKGTRTKAKTATIRKAVKEIMGDGPSMLFPPHLDRISEMASIEFAPGDPDVYGLLLESICGAVDDSQPVEQYDGTLGVPTAFVNAHQSAVGQIQWNDNLASIYTNPGDVTGVRWCSGTMISNDLFLAAGHCFDQTGGSWARPKDNATGATISPAEIATNMHVNFNYQVDPAGNLRTEQSFAILALVEYRLGGLDFAIVRLDGNPGAIFGKTSVSTTDAAVGDMLCIIGHPAGTPKRIEAGQATSFSGNQIRYDDIDTLGGNSGSGILRYTDGKVVGVHTNGGCTAAGTGENSGVRISSILAQSATLQGLTAPTPKLKASDDQSLKHIRDHVAVGRLKFLTDVSLKFSDDGGTLKAVDDAKHPGLDKQLGDHKRPGVDGPVRPPWFRPPLRRGAEWAGSPFVLSTPHHSMAWAGPRESPEAAAGREQALCQYESALAQMESMMQQCLDQLSQVDAEYRQLLFEYSELASLS